MRKFISHILIIVSSAFILSSCVYRVHTQTTNLPPGQAKKITGEKSAKRYAPGQVKKQ